MTIKEVCSAAGLTKKAVAYYEQKGLVHPQIRENGYREYGTEDLSTLRQIACLRLYGLTVEQIGEILQSKEKAGAIAALLPNQLEKLRMQEKRYQSLCRLAEKYDLAEAEREKKALEVTQTIREKFHLAFPGGYGDYLCFHFGFYLNEPLDTPEKEEAYEKILTFLDDLHLDGIDPELERYLERTMADIQPQMWEEVDAAVRNAVADPKQYLEKNGEAVRDYLNFTKTEEFLSSPAARLKALLRQLMDSSGYNTVFLPNLRIISKSYQEYCRRLERADEVFLRWIKKTGER